MSSISHKFYLFFVIFLTRLKKGLKKSLLCAKRRIVLFHKLFTFPLSHKSFPQTNRLKMSLFDEKAPLNLGFSHFQQSFPQACEFMTFFIFNFFRFFQFSVLHKFYLFRKHFHQKRGGKNPSNVIFSTIFYASSIRNESGLTSFERKGSCFAFLALRLIATVTRSCADLRS